MSINTAQFKDLYIDLISCVPKELENDLSIFFPQAGKKYFEENERILFIGKSVNGWVNESLDINELFDEENKSRIVNRDDEIYWVEKNDHPTYNSNQSSFWRVIKMISLDFYKKEDWYNYIAWTNLYKLSPAIGGNPSSSLCNLQYTQCVKILDKEINYLDPKFVIFLTSFWERDYLELIGINIEKNRLIKWDNHETYYQKYKNKIYIQSKHPQAKKETPHTNAIMKILHLYK
jgi:hypothetical protein